MVSAYDRTLSLKLAPMQRSEVTLSRGHEHVCASCWSRVVRLRWLALLASFGGTAALRAAGGVEVKVNEAAKRVDVTIDGKPFTSYIWPATAEEAGALPAAHGEGHARHARLSARSAQGGARRPSASRRAVAEPRRRQRPRLLEQLRRHQAAIRRRRWGRSFTARSSNAKSGATQGELTVETAWMTPDNKQLLKETTRFVFRGGANSPHHRSHHDADRARPEGRLQGQQGRVPRHAHDARARAARREGRRSSPTHPARRRRCPSSTTPASPASTSAAKARKGTRSGARAPSGRCSAATIDGEPVTVAILDHPSNVGYPTHWHARGYGLFAANPLGDKQFNEAEGVRLHARRPASPSLSSTAC